jgi:hypothetical protein
MSVSAIAPDGARRCRFLEAAIGAVGWATCRACHDDKIHPLWVRSGSLGMCAGVRRAEDPNAIAFVAESFLLQSRCLLGTIFRQHKL